MTSARFQCGALVDSCGEPQDCGACDAGLSCSKTDGPGRSGGNEGAIFFTSNDPARRGTLTIRDSLLHGTTQGSPYWQWRPGISTNANALEPVNSEIR